VRKDGGSDGRGVGFYFRNVTELILFGVRGKNIRTLAPGRRQVNLLATRKQEHSRKPDEQYAIIEACSEGPYLELFARGRREGWTSWGAEADDLPRLPEPFPIHVVCGDIRISMGTRRDARSRRADEVCRRQEIRHSTRRPAMAIPK
jgi:hypothetical protein